MGVEENKAVIRRWVEVTNAHDINSLVELFTPDTFDHVGRRAGPEWWRQVFEFLYATLPDWRWTLEDLVAEGDRVVYRWTTRATHRGEFLGGAPTGRRITATGIVILRIAGGKITEAWQCHDLLGLKQQLGLLPDASPAGR